MLRNQNRNIKILGGAWLAGGGIFLAITLLAIAQVIINPSSAEDGVLGGVVFVLVLLALGSVFSLNGLALLRRNRAARVLIAASSLVLLVPSAVGVVTVVGIPGFLVVVGSLWLTMSRAGKQVLEGYMVRAKA